MILGQPLGRFRRANVEEPGRHQSEQHGYERAQLDPQRHVMEFLEDLVLGAGKQRALPECGVVVTEEEFLKQHTGKQCASSQNEQRHQHHHRRFMCVMHHI